MIFYNNNIKIIGIDIMYVIICNCEHYYIYKMYIVQFLLYNY